MSLSTEIRESELRLKRLRAAADRKRRGIVCDPNGHEWRNRGTMAAASGHESFRKNVRAISGVNLPHAGYHVLKCLSCGQWGLTDYCSGGESDRIYDITAGAAKSLL
jgi:hypothetical protein